MPQLAVSTGSTSGEEAKRGGLSESLTLMTRDFLRPSILTPCVSRREALFDQGVADNETRSIAPLHTELGVDALGVLFQNSA